MSHIRYCKKWYIPACNDRYPHIPHGRYKELRERDKEILKNYEK